MPPTSYRAAGWQLGFKLNPVQTPGTPQTLGQFDPEHSYCNCRSGATRFRLATWLTEKVEVFAELHYSGDVRDGVGLRLELVQRMVADGPYNHLYDDPNSPQFNGGPPARHTIRFRRRSQHC
jgi:hypothetical protein